LCYSKLSLSLSEATPLLLVERIRPVVQKSELTTKENKDEPAQTFRALS
jgi:hypothetical protein